MTRPPSLGRLIVGRWAGPVILAISTVAAAIGSQL